MSLGVPERSGVGKKKGTRSEECEVRGWRKDPGSGGDPGYRGAVRRWKPGGTPGMLAGDA